MVRIILGQRNVPRVSLVNFGHFAALVCDEKNVFIIISGLAQSE